jgi:hypothetical protein
VPKVEIDTPGVTIRLDANEASTRELADIALQLYKDANAVDDTKRSNGLAFGFSGDRRGQWDLGYEDKTGFRTVAEGGGDERA